MKRSGGRRVRVLRTFGTGLATATVIAAVLAVATIGAGASTTTKGSNTATLVVSTTESQLGTILVAGKAVYTLKANGTSCTAKCLKAHPLVVLPSGQGTPTAGSGVDATKLGTAPAGHGKRQVTYAGQRLYRSAKDRATDDVNGNGKDKWGKWSAVAVAGNAAAPTTVPTTAPAPETVAPGTAPPATATPQTAPPETSPPATQPTTPPKTTPTTSPGGGGVGF